MSADSRKVVLAALAGNVAIAACKFGAAYLAHSTATLAEESELLRRGLVAERQGRSAEAAAILRELLTRFPRSPLAADAGEALARVEAGARP